MGDFLYDDIADITGDKSYRKNKPKSEPVSDALSQSELEGVLRKAGWDEKHIPTMSAIGMAESTLTPEGKAKINSYNPGVGHGGKATVEQSIGPWQINMHPSLGRTYDRKRLAEDPVYNAIAAKEIFDKQGLKAWGSYTDQRYKKFLNKTSQSQPQTQPVKTDNPYAFLDEDVKGLGIPNNPYAFLHQDIADLGLNADLPPSQTGKPLMAPPGTAVTPTFSQPPVVQQVPLASGRESFVPVGASGYSDADSPDFAQPAQAVQRALQTPVAPRKGVRQPVQPRTSTSVNVGTQDIDPETGQPIAQPQVAIRNDQEAKQAEGFKIDFPDSVKTVEQAKAYAKKQLQAQFPKGDFSKIDFSAPWSKENRSTQVSYETLQRAGIDTAPIIEQKRAENRIENPTPNLNPVPFDFAKDTADAINEYYKGSKYGEAASAAAGGIIGGLGEIGGVVSGLLGIARDLNPAVGATQEILGDKYHVRDISDSTIDRWKQFYDGATEVMDATGGKNPDGTPTIPTQVFRFGGKLGVDLPKLAVMSMLPGGAITAFALNDAALTKLHGGTGGDVAKSAVKGGFTGGLFHFVPPSVKKLLGAGTEDLAETATHKLARATVESGLIFGGSVGINAVAGDPIKENLLNAAMNTAFHVSGLAGRAKKSLGGKVVHVQDVKGNEVYAKITPDGTLKTVAPQKADFETLIPKPDKVLKPLVPTLDARDSGKIERRPELTNEDVIKSTAESGPALADATIDKRTGLPKYNEPVEGQKVESRITQKNKVKEPTIEPEPWEITNRSSMGEAKGWKQGDATISIEKRPKTKAGTGGIRYVARAGGEEYRATSLENAQNWVQERNANPPKPVTPTASNVGENERPETAIKVGDKVSNGIHDGVVKEIIPDKKYGDILVVDTPSGEKQWTKDQIKAGNAPQQSNVPDSVGAKGVGEGREFILPKGEEVTKPMAAKGLTSYRYRTDSGHVAIGAKDNIDALSEAGRSITEKPTFDKLDVWNGTEYVPVEGGNKPTKPTPKPLTPKQPETAKEVGAKPITDESLINEFEAEYKKLTPAYRKKLLDILARPEPERRKSGLDLLALKAMASSPAQKLIQALKTSSPEAKPEPFANNKIVTADRVAEIRKELGLDKGKVQSGFTPKQLALWTELGAAHIEAGARKFADFSKRMIAEGVDFTERQLREIYNAIRDKHGFEGMDEPKGIKINLKEDFGKPKPPTVEPERGEPEGKESKLGRDIRDRAFAEGLATDWGEIAKYSPKTMAEQSARANALIDADRAKALRIVNGTEDAPQGLHPESVYTALRVKAQAQVDVKTLRELANVSLASEASILGQRIKMLDTQDPNDPVKLMRSIEKFRQDELKREGIVDVHTRIKELETKLSEHENTIASMRAKNELGKPDSVKPFIDRAEAFVKRLDQRADAARERLKKRGAVFTAGIDPQAIKDLAEIGASHIGHLGLDFAKFSDKMIDEFGDKIKPHLDSIYAKAQEIAGKPQETALKAVKTRLANQIAELEQQVSTKTKSATSTSKIEYDDEAKALVARRDELKAEYDKIFGKPKYSPSDAAKIKMRTASLESQISKLETEITFKKRTEERKGKSVTSPEIKALETKRDGLKEQRDKILPVERKASPMSVEMKQSLYKKSLEKQIEILNKRIETGQKPLKGKKIPTTPALEALKKTRDELKAKLPEVNKKISDAQYNKMRQGTLEKQIKDLEDQIATKVRKTKEQTARKVTPEVGKLIDQRDALKSQYDEIFQKPGLTDAQRLDAYKKRAEQRITDLKAQLGGAEPKAKREPVPLDAKGQQLQTEIDLLKNKIELSEEEIQQITDLANTIQKAKSKLTDEQGNPINRRSEKERSKATPEELAYGRAVNDLDSYTTSLKMRNGDPMALRALKGLYEIPRKILTVGHGGVIPFTHARTSALVPGEGKIFADTVKRAYSYLPKKGGTERLTRDMASVRSDPLYDYAVKNGLAIKISTRPVGMGMSRWTNASFDALKGMRLDLFKRAWRQTPEGMRTKEYAQILAKNINHATGEAATPPVVSNIAKWAMFAPKLRFAKYASAFSDPAKSKFGAKRFAKILAVNIGLLAVNDMVNRYFFGKTKDDTVNWTEPAKADWLRMKIAGMTVPMAPTFEVARLPVRLGSVALDPKQYNKWRVAGTEIAGAAHPTITMAYDLTTGKDMWSGKSLPFKGASQYIYGEHRDKDKDKQMSKKEYASEFAPIPLQPILKELSVEGVHLDPEMAPIIVESLASGLLGEHVYEVMKKKKK